MPAGPTAPRQLVFAIDRAYRKPLAAALQSFLAHHDSAGYRVAVLHKTLRPGDEATLGGHFKKQGLALDFIRVERDFSAIKVGHHFHEVIFYRLLIPELFPDLDRALYLDADILFLASVDELFALDLGAHDLGAVPTHAVAGVPPHLRGELARYYASGLLLMNLPRFRAGNYAERMLEFLRTRRYEMPDQDALNYVARDCLELPARWSYETAFFREAVADAALRLEGEAAKIVQFSTGDKPWHLGNRHPLRPLFWRYLRMTPYRRTLPSKFTPVNVLKTALPAPAYAAARGVYRRWKRGRTP